MKLTDQEVTAQEMVDWANANMERVEELEAKIERLKQGCDSLHKHIAEKDKEIEHLQAALQQIVDEDDSYYMASAQTAREALAAGEDKNG